ncbi:hypothetical protein M5X00_11055 [Paenibacillus alvei]|uniref:Uncharacterized protein n=1 Tax=Paenibacillus alvei TaxID=44250 RepID=A0ABT4GTK6_PAEAL|nr:hypothetical protein [Paenibacillus alvei]EJW16226.1 hypothetical protein PAV_6c03070 [Paenibacillus alvei DSM 29]MCY9544470.1 hypothetical protein [Paenibacillus alvei]MCY9704442.1 hypothetical protein [Paenibacillus alvei]MCY9736179.1 hypothetical protein [Paenibacillus alvei]MCY9754783.1 hypothetical protein [Paenibacillus alvei]
MSTRLSNTLKEQMESTNLIARELLGNVNFDATGNEVIVTAAQESALDTYGDMLEAHEHELIEQLHRVVVEYSAKIAANRNLQRLIGREVGRREVLRERIEAGEDI